MPIVGLIETPKEMPRSITEAVLGDGTTELPAGATAASETR
jgi:ubiquinol-cytochrome c reductase cytochrome b subunit